MNVPDLTPLLLPLQLYPWHSTALFVFGLLLGAALFAVLVYRRQLKWQQESTEQLEENIQTRTFELQVALNELADKNRILEEQNTQDALTGVRNRAYFDKKILAELKRSRREQRPLALVMLDIDHFKQINDNHGHLAGDVVIRGVAERIQNQLKRSSDYVCRYGGEEFALILPNTDATGVLELAEQIRLSIAAAPFDTEIGQLHANISAGCYAAVAAPEMLSTDFIHAADQALYQAKAAGRNQVVLAAASEIPAPVPASEGTPDELFQ